MRAVGPTANPCPSVRARCRLLERRSCFPLVELPRGRWSGIAVSGRRLRYLAGMVAGHAAEYLGGVSLDRRSDANAWRGKTGERGAREMEHRSRFPAFSASSILPVIAVAFAIGIFLVDTATPLDIAIAVLYVVVVLLAANFLQRRGVLLVAAACLALTVLSFLLTHGLDTGHPLARCVMSVSAIGATAFLALKNQSANDGAARAGPTSGPHARHDFRPRHERRHHLLEPRRRGALRIADGTRRSARSPMT